MLLLLIYFKPFTVWILWILSKSDPVESSPKYGHMYPTSPHHKDLLPDVDGPYCPRSS